MSLGEYPLMQRYGWLADRFGVCWQLALTTPEGDPRPFITPQFLFVGESPQADAAISKYIVLLTAIEVLRIQIRKYPVH